MATSQRGIALLIANSSYDHLDNIENALNDESAMSRRLESCDYEIISAINLDIDEIKMKILHLQRRLVVSQHREVLIYYAGHGLVHNNEHYITGGHFNEKAELLDNEIILNCLSVDLDIISNVCKVRLSGEKTRSFVVILDACRKSTKPLERGTASDGRLFVPLKPPDETKIGVLVCYACALGLGARDSGEHGLYTDCILQNIFEPGKSIVDAISIANRMATKRANADQQPVMQVNYTDFFQYPLIQGAPALDEPQRTRDRANELLQAEHEELKLEKEQRDRDNELLQTERDKLKLEKEKRDRDNKLLQTEHDRLKFEKEKFEQEFQLAQIELEKLRLEKSKREGQISDMNVMEKLYELTGGALWTKNKDKLSWQPNKCTSEFREADDRITCIDLKYNNLTGLIPSELGSLSGLTYLSLNDNGLHGTIPLELRELKNLMYLKLRNNQLTGAIPVELGKLSKLEKLWFNGNQLTGAIPLELGKLSGLKELWLNGNQLTGAIPKELGELKSLAVLSLHENKLTGAIPKELGELSNLKELWLYSNQLTGAIPKELGELKSLTILSLHENKLTGAIPKELGELSKLEKLCLYSSQLTGAIPKELGELKNLTYLRLDGNQLTGAIPKELGELKSLTILGLRENKLTGGPPIIPRCVIFFEPQALTRWSF